VWTHYNQQMNTILEDGDIDEALSAHAVGDDAINLKCKVILFGIFYTRNLWTTQILVYDYKTGDLNQGNSFDAQR
jgi:predicted metalloprotease